VSGSKHRCLVICLFKWARLLESCMARAKCYEFDSSLRHHDQAGWQVSSPFGSGEPFPRGKASVSWNSWLTSSYIWDLECLDYYLHTRFCFHGVVLKFTSERDLWYSGVNVYTFWTALSRTALRPKQPPIQYVPGVLPGDKAAWSWSWQLTYI
jgi:hypothetical protein